MYANTYFKMNDFNRECDECGWVYKRSQLRKRYDGLIVCQSDWEPRHENERVTRNREGTIPRKD